MSAEPRVPSGADQRGTSEADSTRRDRILNAAVEQFADKGFAAVRIDAIAAAADANKQLIYYYFSNKAGLYEAVLEFMVRRTAGLWDELETAPSLAAVLWRLGEWSQFSTTWRRLLTWEGMEYAQGDRAIRLETVRTSSWARWIDIVRRAQQRGEVSAELDTQMLALILIGLTGFTSSLPQVAKMITGVTPDSREFQQRFTDLTGAMLEGLAPPPDRPAHTTDTQRTRTGNE